jgi:hypothetical protein
MFSSIAIIRTHHPPLQEAGTAKQSSVKTPK